MESPHVSARIPLAALLCSVASFAHAQEVPAIVNSAQATTMVGALPGGHVPSPAQAGAPSDQQGATQASAPVPATMPPPVPLLAPGAKLNKEERGSVAVANKWRARPIMPAAGEDGVVRFTFGAPASVICAPWQACDLELQPGEVVNNVNVGDKVRWNVLPAMSGIGAAATTHLIIKPADAGLVSSMLIFTSRRTYSVKLVSTQSAWVPRTGFNYPDDAGAQWQSYHRLVGLSTAAGSVAVPTGTLAGDLDFGYCLNGDKPSWKPLRVYSDGAKTYIDFPRGISDTDAPALVGLNADGGWFSRPSQRALIYRSFGNRFVVDGVLDRAELISGVDGSQTRVRITRGASCR